jgi:hypothetical protein
MSVELLTLDPNILSILQVDPCTHLQTPSAHRVIIPRMDLPQRRRLPMKFVRDCYLQPVDGCYPLDLDRWVHGWLLRRMMVVLRSLYY